MIDTSCFQRHKSSPLQCLAQNKKLKGGCACCEVCESPHQREKEGRWCLGFREDFDDGMMFEVTTDMETL